MLIVLLMRKSHPLLDIRQQILGQASNLNVSQTSGEISLSTTHEHGRFTISLKVLAIRLRQMFQRHYFIGRLIPVVKNFDSCG